MLNILFFLILLLCPQTKPNYFLVNFGRQGADCSGRGICSFSAVTNVEEANATLFYSARDSSLQMDIFRNRLSPDELQQQFGNGNNADSVFKNSPFIVDAACFLPTNILEALQISIPKAKIKAALYTIQLTKEFVTVNFKLR